MKLNTSIVVSSITLIIGLLFHFPYLWIPISVIVASFIDLLTRQWVISNRIGSMQNLSAFLKFLLALVGFYAMIGQIVCIALIAWWFLFQGNIVYSSHSLYNSVWNVNIYRMKDWYDTFLGEEEQKWNFFMMFIFPIPLYFVVGFWWTLFVWSFWVLLIHGRT